MDECKKYRENRHLRPRGSADFKMGFCRIVLYFIFTVSSVIGKTKQMCESSQYVAIDSTGTIKCSFQESFHAVLWYYSAEINEGKTIIQMVNSVKDGEGYHSGEYDICTNGSLIIYNVTLRHEGNISVAMLPSQDEDPVVQQIRVVVTVKPTIPFPVVNRCGEENSTCFKSLDPETKLTCTVEDVRPAVALVWVDRTSGHDRHVSFQSSVSRSGSLFTTSATTQQAFPYSSALSLLTCKAEATPGILLKEETTILLENSNLNIAGFEPILRFLEKGSTLRLTCKETNISLIVWKKAGQMREEFHILAYASLFQEGFANVRSHQYEFQKDDSLVLPQVEAKHEGFYGCTFENDKIGNAVLYHVVVYVTAVPFVHGCTGHSYCVLDVGTEGTLLCSLNGIRPKVLLVWKTLHDGDASLISFTNQQVEVRSIGEVYDITLTSTYQIQDTRKDRITLECRISESNIQALQSSTKIDILISNAHVTDAPMEHVRRFPLWLLAIVLPICLVAIVLCLFIIKRGGARSQNWQKEDSQPHEKIPLVSSVNRNTFLKDLKTKYKDQYDAVQPIPYIRDRLYCVDRVFVEGGFEKLISQGRIEGYGDWEKLNSYHEVLHSGSSSTRTIIEGDPGYGKSTLTLQMAYDWCNRTTESPLANVGIFILLRLRQLGGVPSVFKAIKQFILPRDSILEETDIATVMYESNSTVIILDGYDEYPEEETNKLTDIISIIRREMFQDNLVILTTRSSLLPKSYPPNTQRIRLTGFDAKARDTYIRKAVVGEDKEAAEKIKRSLHNNPVLQGLCQVPLFFVMFAHMTHESETFLKFNSVTSFFRYMINCFHSHLANKQKDPNVEQFTLHEDKRDVLDEIAFEGLSGKNQKIVWEKRELTERLGFEFYDHYKRIGILVEEEVLDLEETPDNIQYKVEVRFYHKLFCEWYAAHCLSRRVVQPEVNLNKLLEHMNPFDLQYTYRFACGLNSDAGDKIIEYLRGIKDGDKFAVLCILEQSGKIDQIKDTIRDMCSNYIIIDNNDSLLLQGSIVQLLEIGAGNQMPISFLWLKNCFNSVDLSTGSILLKSELSLPVLATLEEIAIGEGGRKMENDDVANILEYALMCNNLKTLRFCHCLLPEAIHAKCLSSLQSRLVQVLWITDDNEYCLNFISGKWEEIKRDDKLQECNIQAKKNILIPFTRERYKQITSAIKPVPTDQQIVNSVNEIFVDGGIEGLTCTDNTEHAGRWEDIDSYQIIFSESRFVSKRRLIEGGAGFGKSTLALKLAFDWSNNNNKSSLSKIEIFFMIRLNQKELSKSIFTQMKSTALPKDAPLSGLDIKQILQSSSSALLVLDDVNFNTDQSDATTSEILDIVRGKLLSNIHVIFTSSSIPNACARETLHLRLTGFNHERRLVYIRKVFGDNHTQIADRIKLTLHKNSIINDFLRVPFFFVLFTHKIHENKTTGTSSENKDMLKCILECFHSYLIGKTEDSNSSGTLKLEQNNLAVGKFTFVALGNSCDGLQWRKDEMIDTVGQIHYDYYLQMGILVEHENHNDFDGNSKVRKTTSQVKVQFYDKSFAYWYVAYYIAKGKAKWSSRNMKNAVESSSYLKTLHQSANNSVEFAMLWISDQGPYVSCELDIVKELCSSEVTFDNEKNEVLQSSMIRILEIASNNKISISCVYLENCYSTVDLRGGNHLQLQSNLSIPVLTTLNELVIDTSGEGREITSEEFTGILQYSSKCLALEELRFDDCLLPPSVQAESVSVLRSRNVKVIWWPSNTWYQLNLQSCLWEYNNSPGREMTGEDYQREVRHIKQLQDELKEKRGGEGRI